MKIRIKETGEIKDLIIRDRETGREYTAALVEDDNCITYNRDLEVYETDQASYDWWDSMIEQMEYAEDTKESYINKYGEEAVEETLAQYDTPTDLKVKICNSWTISNIMNKLSRNILDSKNRPKPRAPLRQTVWR